MTWPKIWHSIYDCCSWQAFAEGLIDNYEKGAFSEKLTKFKIRVQKPSPIYDEIGKNHQNQNPIYDQNGWKSIPFGAAHTYIASIREYPFPGIQHPW